MPAGGAAPAGAGLDLASTRALRWPTSDSWGSPVANETIARFLDLLRGSGTVTEEQAGELRVLDLDLEEVVSVAVARGWASERGAARCLAAFERTVAVALTESTLDLRALVGVDENLAVKERILPLASNAVSITVATAGRPTDEDVKRWSERFSRKAIPVRAVGSVLQKLSGAAFLARDHGQLRLRGCLSKHETPHVATVRSADPAATLALANALVDLAGSFAALRAIANADGTLGGGALARVAANDDAAPDTGSDTVGAGGGGAVEPFPVTAPTAVIATHDAAGADAAAALRRHGVATFEAIDAEHLRTLLRSTRPSVVVVDHDLPGAVGVTPEFVRGFAGVGDTALIVLSRTTLADERSKDVHETLAAALLLEGAVDAGAVEMGVLRALGRGPAPRPSTHLRELQGLWGEVGWGSAPGQEGEVLARIDRMLASDRWDAEALLMRGALLDEMKRTSDAFAAWQLATLADPARPDVWVSFGTACDRAGLPRKAERCWRRAGDVATDDLMKRRIADRLAG